MIFLHLICHCSYNFVYLQLQSVCIYVIILFRFLIHIFQGYYRVHYDERNWMLLNKVLQENHELFPPETRASLIDDIFSLATVGFIKYEVVFDFIKYMQLKERHYLPWTALMRHVFKLNRLLYETSIFTDFQVSYYTNDIVSQNISSMVVSS